MEKIASAFAALAAIATVAVLVQSPYTSQVIKATGDASASNFKVVMGSVAK